MLLSSFRESSVVLWILCGCLLESGRFKVSQPNRSRINTESVHKVLGRRLVDWRFSGDSKFIRLCTLED